ncbi:MAG: hypothetical protein C4542_07500 [Dehalococcoidia bacterium]|nr:MAG: hypothetical protein C4542_07500 [Dehalococcoidia bacterium]
MIDYQATPTPPAKKTGGNPLMLIVSGVLAVALIAVGVLYVMEMGKLNKANENITTLEANVSSLQGQLATEKANVASLQTQLATEKANVATLQTQLTTAKSDLTASQAKVTSLTADLATANGKVTSLTADLATANGKVTTTQASLDKANTDLAASKATNTTLQTQLTAIQAKYPLKDFPDYATLNTWVKAHIQPYSATYAQWYVNAMKVQTAAMNDGYFVSTVYYPNTGQEVINIALAGTTLYWFDPEIGTIYSYLTSLGPISR